MNYISRTWIGPDWSQTYGWQVQHGPAIRIPTRAEAGFSLVPAPRKFILKQKFLYGAWRVC